MLAKCYHVTMGKNKKPTEKLEALQRQCPGSFSDATRSEGKFPYTASESGPALDPELLNRFPSEDGLGKALQSNEEALDEHWAENPPDPSKGFWDEVALTTSEVDEVMERSGSQEGKPDSAPEEPEVP